MESAIYDVISYAMRYWFIAIIALMLIGLISVSVSEYKQRKSVMGEIGRYVGYLEFVDGLPAAEGMRIGLTPENLVGSGRRADIVIDDPSVEKSHALLYVKDGALVLSPLGAGETKINGRRAVRAHGLVPGDEVSFGNVTARVYLRGEEEGDDD